MLLREKNINRKIVFDLFQKKEKGKKQREREKNMKEFLFNNQITRDPPINIQEQRGRGWEEERGGMPKKKKNFFETKQNKMRFGITKNINVVVVFFAGKVFFCKPTLYYKDLTLLKR